MLKTYEFQERLDVDGIRIVISIGNERKGGCPFSCRGCGVHSEALFMSPQENKKYIKNAIKTLHAKISHNQEIFQMHGYHVCVYNQGNVTNKEELSRNNLFTLLIKLNDLTPPPKVVALNSRGKFIKRELLEQINQLNLHFDIHFIIGVESLTSKGANIYGKENISSELGNMHATLQKANLKLKTRFGIDAGFVFLPEFYLEEEETRDNKDKILRGFIGDVSGFINKYSGKGVPLKINLHPYYKISGLPYDDSYDSFDIFMEGVAEIIKIIHNTKAQVRERLSLFIGIQGSGYRSETWKRTIENWKEKIDQFNKQGV